MNTGVAVRSQARLTMQHLQRLGRLAADDHAHFTRPGGRPEYRDRRLAVVLAQGAALHYLDGTNGVKDLDVYTFYAATPGATFPSKRQTRTDFGPSELGRHPAYELAEAASPAERGRLRRWNTYTGRRVDFMVRALPVEPHGDPVEAIRAWLREGAACRRTSKPTSWHLARKAVVMIDPEPGVVIWPADTTEGTPA